MKFLDMISRKRSQAPEPDVSEDNADPAPLDEVLKAVAEEKAGQAEDEGAEILEFSEETDLSGASAEDPGDERGFLDDDGSYDWDLSDLAAEEAEDTSPAPEGGTLDETKQAAPEAPVEMPEETALMEETEDQHAADAEDAPAASAETIGILAENQDEIETVGSEDTEDGSDWADEAQDHEDFDDAAFDDEAFDDEAFDEGMSDETSEDVEEEASAEVFDEIAVPEAESHAEPVEEGAEETSFSMSSVTAALRAQMPETPKDRVEDRAPARSSQQALLATIRAARQKAELARAESDSTPAPVAEDPAEPPVPVTEQPGFQSLHPDFGDEADNADEADFAATADDAAFASAEAEDDIHADDAGAAHWVAEEVENLPDPAPASAGRKIWEMDADDSDEDEAWLAVDPKLAAAAADMTTPEEDAAPVAEAPRAPAQPAVDPDVAMAAMTAPRRRAGRVKTRLLGFNKPAQTDPITQAMENEVSQADEPTFPVGWLVVIRGPGRGASFALGAGASKIGRGEDQPVRLDFGDNSISRDNHAVVAYDDESRKFYLGHGGKANLVRLNDMPVLSTETLGDGDLIRIGETVLRFVALCGTDFTWAEDDKGAVPNAAAE